MCFPSTNIVHHVALCALTISIIGPTLFGQEYENTIVSTDFDIIMVQDPSCFTGMDYKGIHSAEMPDKTADRELFQDAYIFEASYSDHTRVELALHRGFDSSNSAETEAMLYAVRLGKLPTVLRSGIKRLVVHQGREDATAFSDHGLIVVYSVMSGK